MKKNIVFGLFLFSVLNLSAQEVLSNKSIIEMKENGLSEEVINAKISSEQGNFDTSLNAILELKKHNLSDETIKLMVEHNSGSKVEEPLYLTSIQDLGNELLINNQYRIKKDSELQINLPYSKDFIGIAPKPKLGLKMLGSVADIVGTGATAVGLGTNNTQVIGSAIKVMNSAKAVEYGVDALLKIDELPISKNAKKIAGKKIKVLSWEMTDDGYVLLGELDKKKYLINLQYAVMAKEISL